MEVDISQDFRCFDGQQTISLASGGTNTSVAGVTTSKLSYQQATALAGALIVGDVTRSFSLPVVNLGGKTPIGGDVITDENGVPWEVLSADLATMNTRQRCACKRQQR